MYCIAEHWTPVSLFAIYINKIVDFSTKVQYLRDIKCKTISASRIIFLARVCLECTHKHTLARNM